MGGIARLSAFARDQRGAFAVVTAMILPVAISAAVLGTEVGLYAFRHEAMQGAADGAALSAVISGATGAALVTQGRAIAAAQSYVDGINSTTVTINSPPLSGTHKVSGAVEVIVLQPQQPLIAKIFSNAAVQITARAVAVPNPGGPASWR